MTSSAARSFDCRVAQALAEFPILTVTVRGLASELGVAHATARRAIRRAKNEGAVSGWSSAAGGYVIDRERAHVWVEALSDNGSARD